MEDDTLILILFIGFLFFMAMRPRTVVVERTEKGVVIVEK